MNRRKLAIALVGICATLMAIMMLYALFTVVFADINPIAAVAAISVAVAGMAWFRKEFRFHK